MHIFSAFILALLICVQSVVPVENLERVAALIRDNKTVEAERQLASIMRSTPNSPAVLNLMGTVRAKQNRLNEAESLFLQAIRNDETFSGARLNLTYLYVLKRAPDKAIFQLREILRFEPNNTEASQRLLELLFAQRKYDELIGIIEKQRAAAAVSPELLVMLGDAYLAKSSLAEAESAYLVALEGRLDNAGALLGLAQIARAKGELRETSIFLARVATLSADSNSPEFLYKFALMALRANMTDAAKSALERALKLRPDEPSYLLALGVAWLSR